VAEVAARTEAVTASRKRSTSAGLFIPRSAPQSVRNNVPVGHIHHVAGGDPVVNRWRETQSYLATAMTAPANSNGASIRAASIVQGAQPAGTSSGVTFAEWLSRKARSLSAVIRPKPIREWFSERSSGKSWPKRQTSTAIAEVGGAPDKSSGAAQRRLCARRTSPQMVPCRRNICPGAAQLRSRRQSRCR
jgi:hypothetical protein